jgi:hypothetical protein
VYGADTTLALNSTAGTIGNTVLSKTMHGATITITQSLDVKYFMDGSATRFVAQNFGRGLRETEFSGMFAKSATALTEAANWLNANAVDRFLELKTISPTVIPTTGTYYSNAMRFSGYWYTRTESIHGTNNTGLTLVCRSVYDPTLTYNTWWQAINARAAL